MKKYILASFLCAILCFIFFGIWVVSLLPSENEELPNTKISQLDYVTRDVPDYRGKILAIVTSTKTMGDTDKKTGYELTELARAYYVFKANGFEIDIASPKGGKSPAVLDDEDMGAFDFAFLNDTIAQHKINNTLIIDRVDKAAYKGVFFVGGKGAMYDFPNNKSIQAIVEEYQANDKVIGAVCHGPAALVNVTLDNGELFLKNRKVSAFTNEEELLLIPDASTIFPFLLQDKLVSQGAFFNEGFMYLEKVSWDTNLITGQNPWSVWKVAETMIMQLGFTPKPRLITSEEQAVRVLQRYKRNGMSSAKMMIKTIALSKEEPVSRTLLVEHSAMSILKGDLSSCFDYLNLASYANRFETN
ncbi:type 1 glutamine amidotransferase domain-containing protein [Ulvibacter litoralis]|nr:type 1 glutamine amidotransferase domain-containing protein [Ulvibacter litoralis]